jgi:hypothetical protein
MRRRVASVVTELYGERIKSDTGVMATTSIESVAITQPTAAHCVLQRCPWKQIPALCYLYCVSLLRPSSAVSTINMPTTTVR